jgi:hypothetical protein
VGLSVKRLKINSSPGMLTVKEAEEEILGPGTLLARPRTALRRGSPRAISSREGTVEDEGLNMGWSTQNMT